jgi:hypothetical protein
LGGKVKVPSSSMDRCGQLVEMENSASHELARFGMLEDITEVWVRSAPKALLSRIL